MNYTDRIEFNPNKMLGKPVVKGTRVSVELILRKLSEGAKMDELLLIYPSLSKEDIFACLSYASDLISNDEIITLKAS